jgi:hypothetical protein
MRKLVGVGDHEARDGQGGGVERSGNIRKIFISLYTPFLY